MHLLPKLNDAPAHFRIERNVHDEPLLIEDIGPHDRHKTVTNDAEDVVRRLMSTGILFGGRRLFYRDSYKQLTEIIIVDREFDSFVHGVWPGRPLPKVGT